MTMIAIYPVTNGVLPKSYRAITGARQSVGSTAGLALDALTDLLAEPREATLVVLQPSFLADRFFTAQQQQRLTELMTSWRHARESGAALTALEQQELEELTNLELQAAMDRTAALFAGTAK